MKQRIIDYIHSRLFFSSPWLLACSAGLLIIIVATFAVHNLRLEKQLATETMLQKAATVMRAVRSGAQASYFADLRRNFWESDSWLDHVQIVINHLVEDDGIAQIGLVDDKGEIIAHNDKTMIGKINSLKLPDAGARRNSARIYYTIARTRKSERLFAAVGLFKPFAARTLKDTRWMRDNQLSYFFMLEGMRKGFPMGAGPDLRVPDRKYYISVGLNMDEYDKTVGRFRLQIVILSLAMMFVGLGGWVSLSVVQGYRVSQKTLSEIKAFTSLLVANLPVGVIATDKTGQVAIWNQAVEKLIGTRQSQALGKSPLALLPKPLAELFSAHYGSGAKNGDKIGTEHELVIDIGERGFVLLCRLIRIYDGDQRYSGDMLLVSDVSKVKLLERKMRESERLAAIGKMAGGVAHEVRNPLSSIKGLALLLKNTFTPGSREENTAELLIQETERMNRAITEMLSFTSPAPLRFSSVNLGDVIRREVDLLQAETAAASVSVTLKFDDGVWPVYGDEDRITQVLMNILLNSLQAMENGGELFIATNNIEDDKMVEIRIRDTGPGMDEDTLGQVFYPYFTTKSKGTGLGLAISQRIVADHKGTISIESKAGEGTTVTIQLPAVG